MNRWLSMLCAVAMSAAPAFGTYVSIQHNLIDGTPDTNFVGGALTISSASTDLELNDDDLTGPTAPDVSNVSVFMETFFHSFDPMAGPFGEAKFTGGSFTLKFDYQGSAGQTYEISGPVVGMVFGVTQITHLGGGDWLTIVEGAGLWNALVKALPGSNDWPDGGGWSSFNALTLRIGSDLTGWEWDSDVTGGQTLYTLTPDDSAVPEPATLMLLTLGGAVLLRRRRNG